MKCHHASNAEKSDHAQHSIPDSLYSEAQHRASDSGVSLERFVVEAIQLHLRDDLEEPESVSLTPDQVAIIRRSQAEIKAGRGLTVEQVDASLAAKKEAWLQNHR